MLKLRNIHLFFVVSLIVSTLARAFCLIYTTEASNGFLLYRMKGLGISLMVFIAATLICLFVFSLFLKEDNTYKEKPSVFLGISSFTLGLALIVDMARAFTSEHGLLWQFAAKQAFGILTAVVFMLYGIKAIKSIRFNTVFFAFPVLFIVFQTIEVFTSYATLAIITEHLFDLAVLCFLLVFLLYFAKNANGINGKYKKLLVPFGFCSSALCIISFLSRTITVLVGCVDRLHGENPLSVSLVFFGIFIFACLNDGFKRDENI